MIKFIFYEDKRWNFALMAKKDKNIPSCFHCGEQCINEQIYFDEKVFCCQGCRSVYEILNQNDMCGYYNLDEAPGISPPTVHKKRFEYLEDEEVKQKIADFIDDETMIVTFYIPAIHCSSCIWLLENLYKLNPDIQSSRVNFLKKQLKVSFNHQKISLRQMVELLASVGYEPLINLDQLDKTKQPEIDRSLWYRVGVAGFAFGNIMLISLPEYFGLDPQSKEQFSLLFGILSILLAVPVVVYSADYYYKSAFNGLKHKNINIDVPITLGIFVLFARSVYEILTQTGPGYLDSLSGLVFFLLMGRVFQQKTYKSLSFERDYRSFLPIAVSKWKDGEEYSISIHQLKVGDEIIIRNQELVPVDSILLSDEANIDNSFVTGESVLIKKKKGDKVNAGAKHVGKTIHLKVEKELAQSYLTQLWNDAVFRNENTHNFETLTNKISVYFTVSILVIAFATAFYWYGKDAGIAFEAFTAVLIIACPCALALSAPFTFGNILRIFGRNKFYVKNSETVEEMARITTIVFDKTGTITQTQGSKATYEGKELTDKQKSEIKSAVYQSSHPLSKMLYKALDEYPLISVESYKEFPGYGIEAIVNNTHYKIGSAEFCGFRQENIMSGVFIAIENQPVGKFSFDSLFRHGLKSVVDELKENYKLKIVSGDNDKDKDKLLEIFPDNTEIHFNCKPEEKLALIKKWQSEGEIVMMIGDGLNDAGALKQSNVGVSVSENINTFSPACDAILDASVFRRLSDFLQYSKNGVSIVIASFIISFTYNIIGMYFAVQGKLSPVFAAILMPISSITVVSFVTLVTNLIAKRIKLL